MAHLSWWMVLCLTYTLGCEVSVLEGPDASPGADANPGGGADARDPLSPWVEIISPTGGEADNPVTFEFSAGNGVSSVTFTADDWPLQDAPLAANAGSLTYDFNGVGSERHIVLTGYDSANLVVATDAVWITPLNPVADRVFPIDIDDSGLFLSNFDSWASSASFGSSRSGGRLHAGCDLYWSNDDGDAYVNDYYPYNNNRPVYAIADGTITAYYSFYLGTDAVEIDHGDFVIRYGEVDDGGLSNGLEVGAWVAAGEQIATMGDLDIGTTWSMLHLELYSGELSGSLTDSDNWSYLHVANDNYQRRGDLMDCTPFLLDLLNDS